MAAPPAYRSDRILIRPKQNAENTTLAKLHGAIGSRVQRSFARIGRVQVVKLPAAMSVGQALAFYRKSGLVDYAEPDESPETIRVRPAFIRTNKAQNVVAWCFPVRAEHWIQLRLDRIRAVRDTGEVFQPRW